MRDFDVFFSYVKIICYGKIPPSQDAQTTNFIILNQ